MTIEEVLRQMRDPSADNERLLWADAVEAEIERLREALEFYADPETYFAILILGDRPCGEFADDLSDDHGHPLLDGPRPGKKARAALAATKPHP